MSGWQHFDKCRLVWGYVWESGRAVVVLGVAARVVASLLPPALFWVSKLIVDTIFGILTAHQPVGSRLWWLVALEFALAILAGLMGRLIDYLDALLAGRYTHYVSIRVMEHAAGLDLIAYEDPVFYDRLERARVQATDRLYMIQAIGRRSNRRLRPSPCPSRSWCSRRGCYFCSWWA